VHEGKSLKKLEGRIAVVTGGTSGIGFAAAERFAAEGARVFVMGRRQALVDAAVRRIGANAFGIQGDVTSLVDLQRLFATIRSQAGRIDVLFASAGGGQFAALGAITEQHYNAIFDTHVKGTLFTVQGALPLLSEGASVILMASSTASTGTPAFSVYSAAKAAVRNFARSWLLDLQPRRIRVNVLSPGPVQTEGLGALAPPGQAGRMMSALAARIPLSRVGQPFEVASAALFLACAESSFVNGIELAVDGGMAQV
jgi:NAD(P)-dependent dehydrogenase (short-subunit alcohol dehydrogenase family)